MFNFVVLSKHVRLYSWLQKIFFGTFYSNSWMVKKKIGVLVAEKKLPMSLVGVSLETTE